LKKIGELKNKIDLLENSIFENENNEIKTQLIQVDNSKNINCALIFKENGANSKLI